MSQHCAQWLERDKKKGHDRGAQENVGKRKKGSNEKHENKMQSSKHKVS
jgi:hypothetical protein